MDELLIFLKCISKFYHFTQGKDYVACGNSTSKKDSQANAAKDFINYLLRTGEMLPNEVPADAGLDQRYHSNIHKKTGWWVRFAYKLGRWVKKLAVSLFHGADFEHIQSLPRYILSVRPPVYTMSLPSLHYLSPFQKLMLYWTFKNQIFD